MEWLRDGGLVALGCCRGDGRLLVQTYSVAGAPGWSASVGSAQASNSSRALAVDAQGNVVVAWQRTDDRFSMTKLDPTGNELWTQPSWPGLYPVHARAMVATPQGAYIVAGYKLASNGYGDVWYGIFDDSGNLVREETFAGSGNAGDRADDIAVDRRGVILLGGSMTSSYTEAWVRMMAP